MSAEKPTRVAVIGAGPAGLMAAERLSSAGVAVTVFDGMPSVARKFLMAGRGGLNLTHGEPLENFLGRYGSDSDARLIDAVRAFPPSAAVEWAEGLGQETFVGTSGRIFPKTMKASPLLRAWLARLGAAGVAFRLRTRWTGFDDARRPLFESDGRIESQHVNAVVLALGGASWPRLGSDGGWVSILTEHGVGVRPLQPANAGVRVAWSEFLKSKCAGKPLKRIAVGLVEDERKRRGEAIITSSGLEGGAIYAVGDLLRAHLAHSATAMIEIDLRPDVSLDALAAKIKSAPAKQSLANTLRKQAGLDAVAATLLHEAVRREGALPRDAAGLAARIKHVSIQVDGFAGMERAISTAGGIDFAEVDDQLMLRKLPGVFIAGEMLDWSAPTGGYLLQACLATGVAAAEGVKSWLSHSV